LATNAAVVATPILGALPQMSLPGAGTTAAGAMTFNRGHSLMSMGSTDSLMEAMVLADDADENTGTPLN
jgi:hypothetical protein